MSEKTIDLDKKPTDAESVVKKVRERYGAFATAGTSCCGPQAQPTGCCSTGSEVASAMVRAFRLRCVSPLASWTSSTMP